MDMDPLTQQSDVQAAIDAEATFGGAKPRGNDAYRTDYAGYKSTPDSACPTNPARAGASPRPGQMPCFPFLQPAVEPDEIGRLGNYRVLSLLGEGGMAFVFLAEDIALRRKVALKVVKPDCADDADGWKRFLREARLMAALKHEHIVPVFQVAQEGGVYFLAMELLQGETLESWCTRVGQATPPDIIRLARGIASGLATIHRQGLVHRDIKPTNLWLEQPEGRVKILDLGLARAVVDDARFTQTGIIVGTPAFMSPEQARGARIDARSDLFSLGAVMYRLAAGRLPFDAPTTVGVLAELAVCKPAPVLEQNPALPRPLAKLIMQLLAKDPDLRPASADAVIAQLQHIETRCADTHTVYAEVAVPSDEAPPRPRGRSQKKRKPASGFAARRKALICAMAATAAVLLVIATALEIGIIAWASAPHAQSAGAATVFLTDMQPTVVLRLVPPEPGHGPPMFGKGPPPPPMKDFAHARINGQDLPHSILMHPLPVPEGGIAKQSYRLGGKYATFKTEVNLNDGPHHSETPLTYTVIGDGRPLWQSTALIARSDRQSCTVSVQNVQVLTIQVECPGAPRGAHAVWVDPHLVK
jgi:serine/threonine protein kinase